MAAASGNNNFLEENVIIKEDEEQKTIKQITEPMTECPICLEDYNEKSKIVTCTCGYTLHIKCCQDYLMYQSKEPHCMYCNKGWDLEFQYTHLTSSFINGRYKKHRKELLFDREKAQFPATMQHVIEYKNLQSLRNQVEEKKKRLNEIKYEENALQLDINNLANKIHNINRGIYTIDKSEKTEKKQFIKPCPVENCRGFLSTAYKCGICSTFSCSKCFEIKGKTKDEIDEHVCDENNVKNAEAIKSETKGCPKCGVPIYKISGCNQMWCTNCNIAFSWKTGRVENGVVHNPHYYQFINNQRRQVRNPGDVVCGGIPDYYRFYSNIRYCNTTIIINGITISTQLFLKKIHRNVGEIQQYIIDPIRVKLNTATNNTDLRVRYLANEIDETHLKKQITARDKMRQKQQSMLHILELYMVTIVEVLNNVSSIILNGSIQKEVNRIKNIACYCNKEFLKVSENYKMKVYYIKLDDLTISFKSLMGAKELQTYINHHKEEDITQISS